MHIAHGQNHKEEIRDCNNSVVLLCTYGLKQTRWREKKLAIFQGQQKKSGSQKKQPRNKRGKWASADVKIINDTLT